MEGAKALSKVIEENKTLRKLYLWYDDSLGEGVDSLLASLQNNTTLQELSLPQPYQRPADSRMVRSVGKGIGYQFACVVGPHYSQAIRERNLHPLVLSLHCCCYHYEVT